MKKNDNAVDLGKLQEEYNAAKKELNRATHALAKAQESFDVAKGLFVEKRYELLSASNSVLN